jgi:hypothetical protein
MKVIKLHKSYYPICVLVEQIVSFQNPFGRKGETLIRYQGNCYDEGIMETPEEIVYMIERGDDHAGSVKEC